MSWSVQVTGSLRLSIQITSKHSVWRSALFLSPEIRKGTDYLRSLYSIAVGTMIL